MAAEHHVYLAVVEKKFRSCTIAGREEEMRRNEKSGLQRWKKRRAAKSKIISGDSLIIQTKSTVMPATMNVHRLATYRDRLQAGSPVQPELQAFRLASDSPMCKTNQILTFLKNVSVITIRFLAQTTPTHIF
ncbi:hypothetical protein Bca52824_040484 [Brassica carinata]|uniref:Uncharacterized protein n=1 Tax=Brassica carinata TaxID=52824 RepID=A0A8X7RVK6_BRACI|nr:hypothetical protein Bca52824_040484 [Brassica carinata]